MRRIDVVYRGFLRKMVRGGYRKRGVNSDGLNEHAFLMTNSDLYKITCTRPLADFIQKQNLKYIAHVTRLSHSSWQKKLLFAKSGTNRQSIWKKYKAVLDIDEAQIRRMMQDQIGFNHFLDGRFGKQVAINPSDMIRRGKNL